jgi:hypothetical protein
MVYLACLIVNPVNLPLLNKVGYLRYRRRET